MRKQTLQEFIEKYKKKYGMPSNQTLRDIEIIVVDDNARPELTDYRTDVSNYINKLAKTIINILYHIILPLIIYFLCKT